jgi:ribonuclease BN (tRNA processing enzyme)
MRHMAGTFIALGTSGWIPSERRETMCFAYARGRRLFLFDCGTGARRLGHPELEPTFASAREVFIFLSHYHLDHTMGVIYLPKLLAGKKVTIAGPGKEACGVSVEDALTRLTTFPLFSHPISGFPMDLTLVDLKVGVNAFKGFELRCVAQEHTAPSLGMRLDDDVAYATDTTCSEQTVDLARGAPLLVHECWLDEEDYRAALAEPDARVLREHSHAAGAADIAKRAEVEMLALAHINPNYREGRIRRMERFARNIFPEAFVIRDFEQIEIK